MFLANNLKFHQQFAHSDPAVTAQATEPRGKSATKEEARLEEVDREDESELEELDFEPPVDSDGVNAATVQERSG